MKQKILKNIEDFIYLFFFLINMDFCCFQTLVVNGWYQPAIRLCLIYACLVHVGYPSDKWFVSYVHL